MEQAIQAASTVNAESKGSADLLKMIGTARGKGRGKDNQAAKSDEDLNALAPFLQFLNKQMLQADKSSSALGVNGKKITLEQAMLLLQGDFNLKELQQALADISQTGDTSEIDKEESGKSGFSMDTLLKQLGLLKKKMASGDSKADADTKIKGFLENELEAKTIQSGNEKIINDKNIVLNEPNGATLGKVGSTLVSGDESSKVKIEGRDLKNAIAMQSKEKKSDDINSQSQLKDESFNVSQSKIEGADSKKGIPTKSGEDKTLNINPQAQSKEQTVDSEIKVTDLPKEKIPVSKTDERAIQPEKVNFKEAQLSTSTAGKIVVNAAAGKEENKISKDIQPEEAVKEDHVIRNNVRLSMQETKESLINKDNLRFAQEQYQNTANAHSGNKVQMNAMQAIMEDVINAEQKEKTITGEKRNEEISSNLLNAVSSGSAKMEKSNSISPGEIINQVTNEIKETAANDGGRVKITLNPPSLGKLEMDVTVRNGKVEVVLVADNKDVQQTLNTHIDKLKGSLQTQGLTIERCDVFMQDRREEYQQSFSQQAFYQDSRSGGQGGNSNRQENLEEKVKIPSIISEQPVKIIRESADSISLFA
jgi:flagellar hook-length control protein FliK